MVSVTGLSLKGRKIVGSVRIPVSLKVMGSDGICKYLSRLSQCSICQKTVGGSWAPAGFFVWGHILEAPKARGLRRRTGQRG